MSKYTPAVIEGQWQQYWADNQTFRTDEDPQKPKFYGLVMFPYPSGDGLHVGHPKSYTAVDIVVRYKRAKGFRVLHPMGWDAFGLPAERYAVRVGKHPAEITRTNIGNFRRQLQKLGFSYDWEREVDTTDPNYYRWTQWIFLKLHEKGWPIWRKCRSIGVLRWERCWPMRRCKTGNMWRRGIRLNVA